MTAGIGIAIDAAIGTELINNESQNAAIIILFNDSIPMVFREGIPLIKYTVNHYLYLFNDKIQGSILKVTFQEIETDPAYYQVESFIGITVLWLNTYFGLNISEPLYFRDSRSQKFIFELQNSSTQNSQKAGLHQDENNKHSRSEN